MMQLHERYSALEVKKLKFAFWELLIKKYSKREFFSQNTPLGNFLTTHPIHTNSNSNDAV
jgi:hypothetical protein